MAEQVFVARVRLLSTRTGVLVQNVCGMRTVSILRHSGGLVISIFTPGRHITLLQG